MRDENRRLRWIAVALGMGWAVGLINELTLHARPASAGVIGEVPAMVMTTDSILYVRGLVLLDQHGTERLRLGAPLPEPIMMGRRFQRGDPVSGIIIYDHEGNERGGYVTGDNSRGAALTLDEINRAAVHIGVGDRGESHVQLGNGLGSFVGFGVVPVGGYLRIDQGGKLAAVLPDTTKGGEP